MPEQAFVPVTVTGRLVVLREFRSEDGDAAFAVVGDDQVTQSLSFDTRTREQTTAMIEGALTRSRSTPRQEFYLAVTVADDELIGFARLGLDGVRAAKLGYAIRADRWGHGYATDAARTLITFGFEQLDLHRISAAMGPENVASIALVKRLGFSYEGRIRDHVQTNGGWRDSQLYSVLDDEWTP